MQPNVELKTETTLAKPPIWVSQNASDCQHVKTCAFNKNNETETEREKVLHNALCSLIGPSDWPFLRPPANH